MQCDVCNVKVVAGEGTKIPAAQFRKLMDKGFGIDPENISMLTESGMPRQQAIAQLIQGYAQFSSDWLLCPSCAIIAGNIAR